MSHIVDIKRPKIQKAIAELGINPDLLITKTLEDFKEDDLSTEILQMRYEYYTRKQLKLVKLIEEKINKTASNYKNLNTTKLTTFMTQVGTNNQSNLNIHNESFIVNEKKRLARSLKSIEKTILSQAELEKKIQQRMEAKTKVFSGKSPKKSKMEIFKAKQLENIKKLRRDEDLKAKKYKFESFTPKIEKKLSVDVNEKSEVFESDDQVSEKIKKIEEKMNKSKRLHESFLRKRKNAIATLLEKFPKKTLNDSVESENEKILKLITKFEDFKKRRDEQAEVKTAKSNRAKSQNETRLKSVKKKLGILDKTNDKKDKILQAKMEKSESLIKKKHDE